MTSIYSTDGDTITLHSADGYNQNVGSDGRAMSIAAFRVAQNSTELTGAPMRRDVVTFLLSPKAVSYWLDKKWLERASAASDGANLVRLTFSGRSECDMSLQGSAALTTDELAVSRWVERMLNGERNSMKSKAFPLKL